MLELLQNINWRDGQVTKFVPVVEYNAALVGNMGLSGPDEGVLPRIDVYKYNEFEYELFAWGEDTQQMFQIIEQIMLKFNPYVGNKHGYALLEADRNTGSVLEFKCKVKKKHVA
jgi:hypothetical protein